MNAIVESKRIMISFYHFSLSIWRQYRLAMLTGIIKFGILFEHFLVFSLTERPSPKSNENRYGTWEAGAVKYS